VARGLADQQYCLALGLETEADARCRVGEETDAAFVSIISPGWKID